MTRMSVSDIKRMVRYDEATGTFSWLSRPREDFDSEHSWKVSQTRRPEGSPALTSDTGGGYKKACINKRTYLAHVVAWAIKTGEWPTAEIDHQDGDRSNNRWENLRHATPLQNRRNMKRPSHNTSGVVGVGWRSQKNKWRAHIQIAGRFITIGHFASKDEAIAARKRAEAEYGFHKNHGLEAAGNGRRFAANPHL